MLDIKLLRNNPELVEQALKKRNIQGALVGFTELDNKRKELTLRGEELKQFRNQASQEVGKSKKNGEDTSQLREKIRLIGNDIHTIDEELREIEKQINSILLNIPNLPHEDVPLGGDDNDNLEIRRWGIPRAFGFDPLPHWDLAAQLDIIDFERAAKLSGARFAVYKEAGARLERAVINFFLDIHTGQHGYKEVLPPFMVSGDCMIGTGQLPKFAEDMFKLEGRDMYMVPTAEVPLTNLHREEILRADQLPLYMTAYTACFRAEAGSAGRDTRGIIRQHQFNKVELVKLTTPETSYEELEKLTANAEKVLQLLGLPYRVVVLCSGDLGFSAAKTYDLEIWLPSYNAYKEISSCSNCTDFQARRANIRYREAPGAKPQFVHTLNGSGVAVGRTVAAIMENCQNEDGTITVPEVLRPYMGGLEQITARK